MALLQVIEELRSRGISIDCGAWYPWCLRGQEIGVDSCAIFYIGGNARVKLHWGLSRIDELLTAVADDKLDVYDGNAWPGQPWTCYCPKGRALRQHLEAFLTPSITQQDLDLITSRNEYCPYLRLKQKNMQIDYWLYQGQRHNGAHYPLVLQTCNASARSDVREAERNQEKKERKQRNRYRRYWY